MNRKNKKVVQYSNGSYWVFLRRTDGEGNFLRWEKVRPATKDEEKLAWL